MWKPSVYEHERLCEDYVSEELSSVETATSSVMILMTVEFQKNLVVWKLQPTKRIEGINAVGFRRT